MALPFQFHRVLQVRHLLVRFLDMRQQVVVGPRPPVEDRVASLLQLIEHAVLVDDEDPVLALHAVDLVHDEPAGCPKRDLVDQGAGVLAHDVVCVEILIDQNSASCHEEHSLFASF